jgi:hypothetical protein
VGLVAVVFQRVMMPDPHKFSAFSFNDRKKQQRIVEMNFISPPIKT